MSGRNNKSRGNDTPVDGPRQPLLLLSQATESYLFLHIRRHPEFRHALVKRVQVFDIVVLRRYPGDNLHDFWGRHGGILGRGGRDRTQPVARNAGHRGTISRMSVAVSRRLRRRGRKRSAATRRWCRYRSPQTNCGARKDK